MKNIIIVLVMMLFSSNIVASIVNNSTSSPTGEDSISVIFYSLDSVANPTTADSVFILVSNPGGTVSYKDSVSITDSRILSVTIRGKQFYLFREQVSNIDGSGVNGVYVFTLLAKKNTENFLTPNSGTFQIISSEFSDQIAQIDDSVYVRGGAVDSNRTEQGGGSDSTSISRWVWNTPQVNHTGSGTFGKYLDTEVSGISGGTGAYSVSLVTYDSSLDMTVPQVSVSVRNLDQSALMGLGTTGSSGTVAFNLDAASFIVLAAAPGYLFTAYDTLVVTGSGTDTVFGYPFDPGTPSFPNLCRVWGYLYGFNGQAEAGAMVSAHLPGGVVRFGSVIISPFTVSTITDSTGYFAVDLSPSELLTPSDTKYEITITRTDGTILRQRVTIPDTGSWQLTW